MKQLTVDLGAHSYPIYIGSGVLASTLQKHLNTPEVLVVSNPTVMGLYGQSIKSQIVAAKYYELILPEGEQFKTLSSVELIFTTLLEQGFSRKVILIALGGGVIGDMTGFAAACYQRGVDFIQIPTTLLAQVDSSVGGKTAVNHALGKNMIGAFHQPKAVLIDTYTLKTLPKREFSAGLAEVIKYGLIRDAAFFSWLEVNQTAILSQQSDIVCLMISRCCEIKAELVSEDETEQGLRAILNFGHTFAHAIEHILGYGTLLHGEAVSIGMVLALTLSERLGLIEGEVRERTIQWLLAAGLPIKLPEECTKEAMQKAMARDKKKIGTTLRFIVLASLGSAVIRDDVPLTILDEVLA